MSLLLLSLGLSLGVTAMHFVTQFLAYLAASSSVFGCVFFRIAWVFLGRDWMNKHRLPCVFESSLWPATPAITSMNQCLPVVPNEQHLGQNLSGPTAAPSGGQNSVDVWHLSQSIGIRVQTAVSSVLSYAEKIDLPSELG
jgi:hypothetical protein